MALKYQLYTKDWINAESPAMRQKRAKFILRALAREYPEERTMLHYENPVQLLVAVMLSAQCTDARVNIVTKPLFKKYLTAKDFAQAKTTVFEKEIFSTGFYHAKTRHIIAAARIIDKDFEGAVPHTMAALLMLPGVARKTANVVLSNAYNISEGIAVDTHVARITQRLGLTRSQDPKKIERDLMSLFPRHRWADLSYYFIRLGREVCGARILRCEICPLRERCPSAHATSEQQKK